MVAGAGVGVVGDHEKQFEIELGRGADFFLVRYRHCHQC